MKYSADSGKTNAQTSGLSASEIRLLDCLNDASDELRQLMQRWDNRLTLKNLDLAKAYAEGRCSVTLYLEIGTTRRYVNYAAPANSESASRHRHAAESCVNVRERGDGSDGNQQSVLIRDVQTVQGAKTVISSLVRFYFVDDKGNNVGPRDLHFSAGDRSYKFLPRISERELSPFGRSSTRGGHDLAGHKIKSRAEIVNSVANDQGNIGRHRLALSELDDVISRVLIFLNFHTAEVRVDEIGKYPIKLLDVLIGPFDL